MTVIYSTHGLPLKFSSISWWRSVVFRWRGGVFKYVLFEMTIVCACWFAFKMLVMESFKDEERAQVAITAGSRALAIWHFYLMLSSFNWNVRTTVCGGCVGVVWCVLCVCV